MSLNIKNERVCALAREAAERLEMTQTSAIEEGLRLLLAQHGHDPVSARVAERLRVLREIREWAHREHPRREGPFPKDAILTDHDLYDPETGLPAA